MKNRAEVKPVGHDNPDEPGELLTAAKNMVNHYDDEFRDTAVMELASVIDGHAGTGFPSEAIERGCPHP